jgi:hypothetical protein
MATQDAAGGVGEAAARAQREQQSAIAARRKYRRIREELEKVRRRRPGPGTLGSFFISF